MAANTFASAWSQETSASLTFESSEIGHQPLTIEVAFVDSKGRSAGKKVQSFNGTKGNGSKVVKPRKG